MHPNTDCVSLKTPVHASGVMLQVSLQHVCANPLDVPCMVLCLERPLSMVQSDV